MDVDQERFRKELLPILKSIARAQIITFDLEMSGIRNLTTKSPEKTGGKGSLKQLYDEVSFAAETFQILQFGITCIEEDREKGSSPYEIRTKLIL